MRMKPSCAAGLPALRAALQAPPANVTAFIERHSRR